MKKDSYVGTFFSFFGENGPALFNLFLCAVALMLVIQWALWLFKLGRFKKPDSPASSGSGNNLIYILTDFFVKIINDFRHLLALIVIMIFAWVLIYAVIHAITIDENSGSSTNFTNLKDVLQAVVSTLGGIVGSIVGYYFGESVGRSNQPARQESSSDELEQSSPGEPVQPVTIDLDSKTN